jgi:PadR family transcriptional regulator PadR
MTEQAVIGQFEQLVLTAILSLRDDAYGVTIREAVEELAAPKNVSLGAVYATLDRLEDKGLVESWLSEPTAQRGGRSKRHYRLRAAGERALQESIATSKRVCEAVESLWGKWPGPGRRWRPAGQH